MTKRVYGWRPDLPDKRDLYAKKVPLTRRLLNRFPKELDLEPLCSPVENQESIGSCVSHGCVAAMELIDKTDDGKWVDLSRLFGYWIIREDKKIDSGAFIREAIKAFAKYGVCDESLWLYDVSKFDVTPSDEAFKDAKKRSGIEYCRIYDYDRKYGIMSALFDKKVPVIFGFAVYANLESPESSHTGIVNLPTEEDLKLGMRGGHCVVIVGWKWIEDRLYFKCRNSWTSRWGIRGYFYMASEYILDANLSDDFWIITKVSLPKNGGVFGDDDVKVYVPVIGIFMSIWNWFKGRVKGGPVGS